MPPQFRLDTAGALHHIVIRGIERRKIFWDDEDRDDFLERLGDLLNQTRTPCYAWALIPNHVHLLVRTGLVSLATMMRRLLTGYAVRFNRRHHRHGHLFQKRSEVRWGQRVGDTESMYSRVWPEGDDRSWFEEDFCGALEGGNGSRI